MNVRNINDEQKIISDEVEELNETKEEPIKIRTIIVKQEDEEAEETKNRRLMKAVKVAAGVGIVAAAGVAVLVFNSKKKK